MVEDSIPNGEVENRALLAWLLGEGWSWWQLQGGGRKNKRGGKRREDLDTKHRDEIFFVPWLIAEGRMPTKPLRRKGG